MCLRMLLLVLLLPCHRLTPTAAGQKVVGWNLYRGQFDEQDAEGGWSAAMESSRCCGAGREGERDMRGGGMVGVSAAAAVSASVRHRQEQQNNKQEHQDGRSIQHPRQDRPTTLVGHWHDCDRRRRRQREQHSLCLWRSSSCCSSSSCCCHPGSCFWR